MKKILLPLLFVASLCSAQEKPSSNGFNLANLCNNPQICTYMAFQESIVFPYEEDKEWQIDNLEVAIKTSGNFLITGDLFILGQDTAVILQIEFLFFDEDNQTIYTYKPDKFEFFNDPNSAEPIMFSGIVPDEVIGRIKYLDVGIKSSERVPYFEISSNCFQPCKALKLKDEMKAFKKKK